MIRTRKRDIAFVISGSGKSRAGGDVFPINIDECDYSEFGVAVYRM